MFAGIVEEVGVLRKVEKSRFGKRMLIECKKVLQSHGKRKLSVGDSVAVSGVCLTVEKAHAKTFSCTAVPETLQRTTLGAKKEGDEVNLERALTLQEGISGHLVQGHVDGMAQVASFKKGVLSLTCPRPLFGYLLPKGSLAVDGISLTIARLGKNNRVQIAIIPHTLAQTALRTTSPGDFVNIEIDFLSKAIHHFLKKELRALRRFK